MSTFSELLAQHVMSTPVLSTSPESSINQLEREFVRHGLSAMSVVEHRQIICIISTLDILRYTV
jgi:predicted transcriptional regulator